MSDNKFTESLIVCAVGNLSPGSIGDDCEGCPHNRFSFPGVLLSGVTKDAVMMLSEKCEVLPEGTKAKVAELEASNKELREMVCEFAHYLACPAYVLRPETVKKITDIAAEERSRQ
jgi:hypothetical protein